MYSIIYAYSHILVKENLRIIYAPIYASFFSTRNGGVMSHISRQQMYFRVVRSARFFKSKCPKSTRGGIALLIQIGVPGLRA